MFDHGERHGPIWHKLRERLNADLDILRRRNENDLSLEQTARLRGEIARIKIILSWGDDPKEQ